MIVHPDLEPQWFTGGKLKDNPRLGESIYEGESYMEKLARTGAWDMPAYYGPWRCLWGNINDSEIDYLNEFNEWRHE